jgi:hypothetical protein
VSEATERNCADTRAARGLHADIGNLIRGEVDRLPSDESRAKFWRLMLESVQKNLPLAPVLLPAEPEKPKEQKPPRCSASYDEAMGLIDEIEDLAGSICENGQDFASSVEAKAVSIGESVERAGSATDGQLQALANMAEGLRAWFHD